MIKLDIVIFRQTVQKYFKAKCHSNQEAKECSPAQAAISGVELALLGLDYSQDLTAKGFYDADEGDFFSVKVTCDRSYDITVKTIAAINVHATFHSVGFVVSNYPLCC